MYACGGISVIHCYSSIKHGLWSGLLKSMLHMTLPGNCTSKTAHLKL